MKRAPRILAFTIVCSFVCNAHSSAGQAQPQDHPHLLETDPVDVGNVIARQPDSVTVKNERFTKVFRVDKQTIIRRVDSTSLQIGDFVTVRSHNDNTRIAIADSIEANVDRWEGKITKVAKDTAYITFDRPAKGTAKIVFDKNTDFRNCASDDSKRDCTILDLKVGRHLETIGFILASHAEMRATNVLGIQRH